jgi:hypothetical protein
MGVLRILPVCMALTAAAAPARAGTLSPQELGQTFASCAGRYSALTEHLWAHDGASSDEAARRRDLFVQLTEAAGPDARRAMGWRVNAKAVQRQLLETATYVDGPRAQRAGALAANAIKACDRLLLGL